MVTNYWYVSSAPSDSDVLYYKDYQLQEFSYNGDILRYVFSANIDNVQNHYCLDEYDKVIVITGSLC